MILVLLLLLLGTSGCHSLAASILVGRSTRWAPDSAEVGTLVRFESDPPGTRVYLDGEYLGRTPCAKWLTYTVSCEREMRFRDPARIEKLGKWLAPFTIVEAIAYVPMVVDGVILEDYVKRETPTGNVREETTKPSRHRATFRSGSRSRTVRFLAEPGAVVFARFKGRDASPPEGEDDTDAAGPAEPASSPSAPRDGES